MEQVEARGAEPVVKYGWGRDSLSSNLLYVPRPLGKRDSRSWQPAVLGCERSLDVAALPFQYLS